MQNPWLPLTEAARGIFFAQELTPENTCFNTAEVLECPGDIDLGLIREGLTQIYRENEGFRVRFRIRDGHPQQQVIPLHEFLEINPVLVEENLEETSAEYEGQGLPPAVASWARKANAAPLNLEKGQTVRSSYLNYAGKVWILHTFHHLVADGFAAFNALGRLATLYRTAVAGKPGVSVRRGSLEQLLAAEKQVAQQRQEHLSFWAENPPCNPREEQQTSRVLSEDDTSLAGRRAPAAASALRVVHPVDSAQQISLIEAGKLHGAAWPTVIISAVGSFLARMSGAGRASFGIPQMNRMLPGEAGVFSSAAAQTGCSAVNMLPISVPAGGSGLEQMKQVKIQQERNQDYALARQEAVERLAQGQGGRLFGAQINVVPFDAVLSLGEHSVKIHNISAGPVDDITVCLRGMPGRGNIIYCEIDANPNLYTLAEVETLSCRLIEWLGRWADSVLARASTSELSIATAAEQEELETFNATYHKIDYQTLLTRWQTQVSRSPQQPALFAQGEPAGAKTWQELTYAQLDARAQIFAAHLQREGVVAGDRIGLRFERGIEQYIALYGLLYAGAVYCPILPELPDERVALMCSEAQLKVVVNGPHTQGLELPEQTSTRLLDWQTFTEETPLPQLWPGDSTTVDDPAYLLFTSGSTGKPKGVVVSHRALDNRLRWQQDQIPVGAGDRILHKTPISFDVHVWELYWPLQEGASVVIAAPGGHRDPDYLARTIVEQKITCLHFVPAMLAVLAHTPSARDYLTKNKLCLRYVVCSGEALLAEHLENCREIFGVSPLNLYGPTEAAIDVTYCDTAELMAGSEVPIGRPVWNTRCTVVDTEGQPLPAGVAGELVLSGVQLAQGYINNPQAQQAAFGSDPGTGARFYRTGDRAAWRKDGSIIYLGRTDFQVKIGGQRLELGEIETVLNSLEGVKNAVVLAQQAETGRGSACLVALLEADSKAHPGLIERARATCQSQLPAYMVPSLWDVLETFPLGTSGKVDRKALAAHTVVSTEQVQDSPSSLREQQLANIFGEVLGAGNFGVKQNFLLSGGTSLGALELVALIQQRMGINVTFAQVFAAPTPAELALSLEQGQDVESEYSPVFTLRAGSSGTAWIFLPPAGGLGWCYTPYLAVLPQEDAVVALQARQFSDSTAAFASTLDECAQDYLQRIIDCGYRTINVVGWSVGGTAAVALAAKAQAAGLNLGQVWVLDGYPAHQWQGLPAPGEQETLVALLRMAGIEEPDTELSLAGVIEILQTEGAALGALCSRHCQVAFESMRASAAMMRADEENYYPGEVKIARVEHPEQPYLSAAGWEKMCAKTQVLCLEGGHIAMVTPEGARKVAETFLS